MKGIDLTGDKYGMLTVIEEADPVYYGKQRVRRWRCVCECGKETIVAGRNLRNGNTKSCGCSSGDFVSIAKRKDLSGKRFGRLLVVSRCDEKAAGHALYKCRCNCGREVFVSGSNLVTGASQSCGCLRKELLNDIHVKHGESHTRLYRVWSGMRERCNNPKNISYKFYGARGIRVCDEWNNSYETFRDWAESSGYDWNAPRGACTIDRINVNGDYCADNCRWITMYEQNQNRRNKSDL